MPRRKKPITKEVRERLRVAPLLVLPDDVSAALDEYLCIQLKEAKRERDELLPRVETWRKTIDGEPQRVSGRSITHTSHLSVPLTIWARVAVRARLTESILGSNKVVGIMPIPARAKDSDQSNVTIANNLAGFLNSQILSTRGLGGKEAIELCAAEDVDLGACAIKVIPQPGTVLNTRPRGDAKANNPFLSVRPPRVRWEHIPWMKLIYVNGFGTDTQAMPFVGHEFDQVWGEIESWGRLGHYDPTAVEEIKEHFARNQGSKPESLRSHELDEVYLEWDINKDGIQEAILVTWHPTAERRLRVVWNPFEDGQRPIKLARFDLPGDISLARGQGVSEKLEGPQAEADAIHNIGIEAGKRGIAHVIVLKAGSRAEDEFGGEQVLLPGDVIVTETPDEDVKAIPLGDKEAAMAAIQLEEHTRIYVTRILGLDEARMGNVESGKRVTAQVGMATMQEGRMIIKTALSSFANMLQECSYLTLDLYRTVPPIQAMQAALSPEDAQQLVQVVFSANALTARSAFAITINAQDAAVSQENSKQEMLIINQALFPFYDRIQQIIMVLANPQLPPAAKKPLITLVERMERGMESLLNTVNSVPNPDELLIRVGEIKTMLDESTSTNDIPEDSTDTDEESLVGDLGAGVT